MYYAKNRVIKKIRFNPVLFDLPAVKGYKMQLSKWLSELRTQPYFDSDNTKTGSNKAIV
jgi:hypothetical protein